MKTKTDVKPAHTATPWRSLGEIILTDDGKNVEIGTTRYLPSENSHANAAFIVKAVNAHEELISLLREVESGSKITGLEFRIRQALAKAEQV